MGPQMPQRLGNYRLDLTAGCGARWCAAMTNTPDPSTHERLAAESLVYQYVVAVLLTHVSPAVAEQAASRIDGSEFAEYLHSTQPALPLNLRSRLVALAEDPLRDACEEFLVAGNTRPWLTLLGPGPTLDE